VRRVPRRVVDVSPATLTVEITGTPDKVTRCSRWSVRMASRRWVRTGPLAMGRGAEVTEVKVPDGDGCVKEQGRRSGGLRGSTMPEAFSDRVIVFDTNPARRRARRRAPAWISSRSSGWPASSTSLGSTFWRRASRPLLRATFEAVAAVARQVEGPPSARSPGAPGRHRQRHRGAAAGAAQALPRLPRHQPPPPPVQAGPLHRGGGPRAVDAIRHARESFEDVEYSAEDAARTERTSSARSWSG